MRSLSRGRTHRKHGLTFALLSLAVLSVAMPAGRAEVQTVADLDDLEGVVAAAWTNNGMARIIPPGDSPYNTSLGVIGYESGFDTNLLAALAPETNATFTLYPVEVIETNSEPRYRFYFGATNPIAVHTSSVSIANYPEDWIEDVYGDPPEWLSGGALTQWYADRDPCRQHMRLDLISTSDVPAYIAMLTNAVGYVSDGGTNINLCEFYSNDIAFVAIEAGTAGVGLYVHAPTNVPTLDFFETTNLLETCGWTLPATLDHATDPILWTYRGSEPVAFFASGNAAVDGDGDGLADVRELRLYGTSAWLADSDGDGLSDGAEVMTYGLNPLAADSDGDGIPDNEEVSGGTNPNSADSDGDGLTDYAELRTYFGHVNPMDPDTDDDGLNDYQEIVTYDTYAAPDGVSIVSDNDNDDLSDYNEAIVFGTNPHKTDTDGDGIDDGCEVGYEWNPLDAGTATEDDDDDGLDNLTEYQWCLSPTSSNGVSGYLRLITVGPGSNEIRRIETINYALAAGDLGNVSSRVRVRPLRDGTNNVPQRLHHTQTPGIYINGTEASSMATPIEIPAQDTAVEYRITADAAVAGTNIEFTLTDANNYTGLCCTATFYVPKLTKVNFSGPGGQDVDVYHGQTNTLWLTMPADTNACRVYMHPYQSPYSTYTSTRDWVWTDWVRVKVTGAGADPTSATLNDLDWRSAHGYGTKHTRGIRLAPGSYTFEVGFDMNANGALEAGEVQETCVVNVIKFDLDADTNNDGSIETANGGEDAYEEYAPGLVLCKNREGDGTNLEHVGTMNITLDPEIAGLFAELQVVQGANKVGLYLDAGCTQAVGGSGSNQVATWSVGTDAIPEQVYVDGLVEGQAKVRFRLLDSEENLLAQDDVSVYVTKTVSWSPTGTNVCFWEPCPWVISPPTNIFPGVGNVGTAQMQVQAVSQGWDVVSCQYTAMDLPCPPTNAGLCTLENLKSMKNSGFNVVCTHGDDTGICGVFLNSSNAVVNWINGEPNMSVERWDGWTNTWYAWIDKAWFEDNWKSDLDGSKAIVYWMSCHSGGMETASTNSLAAKAGGRIRLGYSTYTCGGACQHDTEGIFGRMNGSIEDGAKRSLAEAWQEGGYDHMSDGTNYNIVSFGNSWVTLCPAPGAVFPASAPGQRKGFGCVIFDTYMDDSLNAADVIAKVAGGCMISNVRWLDNGSGKYGIGFEFDNRTGTGATIKVDAARAVNKADYQGGNLGRAMDGNRVCPNGDDKTWPF